LKGGICERMSRDHRAIIKGGEEERSRDGPRREAPELEKKKKPQRRASYEEVWGTTEEGERTRRKEGLDTK